MECAGNGVGCVVGEAGAGAVVQSLQTTGRMLAAVARLQSPQLILLCFPRCSREVKADADTPATISVMFRW